MMKFKFFFSLFLFTCLYSCDKNELMDVDNPISTSLDDVKCTDFSVSVETAKYTAEYLYGNEVKDMNPVVYQGKDTVMYAVNFEDGWVLLSADMRAKTVLASATEGTFEQQENNPGTANLINKLANEILDLKRDKTAVRYSELQNNEDYIFWHNMYLGYKSTVKKDNTVSKSNIVVMNQKAPAVGSTTRTLYLCKKLISQENLGTTSRMVGGRMATKWGQDDTYVPWNIKLPYVVNDKNELVYPPAGCTCVAMAQVIYHAHYKFNTPSWLYHGTKIEGIYYDKKNFNMTLHQGQYVENSPRWNLMAKTVMKCGPEVPNMLQNCSRIWIGD